jgi:hypothetical protein
VFSLVLSSEPTSAVTIGLGSSDTTEGDLGGVSAITFIPSSWSTAQAVTVTGVDDNVVDGNIAFSVAVAAALSVDTNYDGFEGSDVGVVNTDGSLVWFMCFRLFVSWLFCVLQSR